MCCFPGPRAIMSQGDQLPNGLLPPLWLPSVRSPPDGQRDIFTMRIGSCPPPSTTTRPLLLRGPSWRARPHAVRPCTALLPRASPFQQGPQRHVSCHCVDCTRLPPASGASCLPSFCCRALLTHTTPPLPGPVLWPWPAPPPRSPPCPGEAGHTVGVLQTLLRGWGGGASL